VVVGLPIVAVLVGVLATTGRVVPTATVPGNTSGVVVGTGAVRRPTAVGLVLAVAVAVGLIVGCELVVGLRTAMGLVVVMGLRLALVAGLVVVVRLRLALVGGPEVDVIAAWPVEGVLNEAAEDVVVGPLRRLGGATEVGLGPATMTIGSFSNGTVTAPLEVVVPTVVSAGPVIS
jgi:hypothetical protein